MSARQRGAAIVALVGAGAAGAIAGGSRRSGPGLGATGVLGLLGAWTVGRRAASALVDAAGPTSDEGRADGSQRARACGEGTGCGGAALVVLIPARDEAVVLPHVVGDLARQAHRVPDGTRGFDVVVVDDGSIDGSGEVALAAAARLGASEAVSVVRVDGGTKGAALASATAELKLAGDRLRAFVVLDADARVPPGFMCAASRLAVEHEAATVRRRTLHASADSLAATQDDEQTLDGALQALRSAGGGAPELRGNGMIVRATALDRAGGWRSGVLTEDLELSMRLVLSGTRVAWTGEAALWEDAAPTLGAFARQRMRWAEGSVRRLLEVDPRSTLAAPVPIVARLDVLASLLQLVVPPAIAGMLVGALVARRPRRAAVIVATLAAGTTLLVDPVLVAATRLDAERRDGADVAAPSPLAIGLRALRLSVYLGHWIPALLIALARVAASRDVGPYRPTPHTGSVPAPWDRADRSRRRSQALVPTPLRRSLALRRARWTRPGHVRGCASQSHGTAAQRNTR